jgi:hypothetical protein
MSVNCFVSNPFFGKGIREDNKAIEKINEIVDYCEKNDCRQITVCGGMYYFSKKKVEDREYIEEELDFICDYLPKNLRINYKILSGEIECCVLRRHGIDLNSTLEKRRKDVTHLGFDKAIKGNIMMKYNYNRDHDFGFNGGEICSSDGEAFDPSERLDKIIKDFDGNIVIIGGKNSHEEFIYNDKLVIVLPSLMSSDKDPVDLGYVKVSDNGSVIEVDDNVKHLVKKTIFK